MDIDNLKILLKTLKKAGVSSFKDENCSLSFYPHEQKSHLIPDPDESSLPVDLRAENINSPDQILHWSDHSVTSEVPLAGDEPL